VLCGGGGARAAEGLREEEDAGKGKNEERPVVPMYRERLKWARKTRRPKEKKWLSSYQNASILGMVIKIRTH
jgi:hypothetical protein